MGAMLTKDALAYFNNSRSALAVALNIKPESTYDWGERVPDLRQLQLEMFTKGGLQAEARLKPFGEVPAPVEAPPSGEGGHAAP